MKTKSYDRIQANLLVPLLESISIEITDRRRRIQKLERTLEGLSGDHEDRFFDVLAELATHRRELRLSERELDQLGCVVDHDQPTRIFIPGSDGDLGHGFQWEIGDSTIHRVVSKSGVQ